MVEVIGGEFCVAAADVEDAVGWLGVEVLKDFLCYLRVVDEVGGIGVCLGEC